MTVIEKIKTINNKTRAQYNLDGQTAKILVLLSRNVANYEFLIGENILPEKDY